MDCVFFCARRDLSLGEVMDLLTGAGLLSSVSPMSSHKANGYLDGLRIQFDELPSTSWGSFEAPQQDALRRDGVRAAFQVSFPPPAADSVAPCLRALLAAFGGWLGLDDGRFEARLTLDDVDGGRLQGALAWMHEEV